MQKNNGITLVVLIIIVVVMLILLSVTVNIAIDGNLFGKAEEAVNKTNKKVGTLQNDVDYYTNLLNKISGTGDSTEFKDIRSNILLDWISLLQTAEGTLNETHSMLSRLNELMFRLNNGTETDISKNYMIDEIEQLLIEITRVSTETEFNEIKLLDGTFSKVVNIDNTTITIGNYSADALNLTTANLREELLTEEGAQKYIGIVEKASYTISDARTMIGSNQNKFEELISFFEAKTDIINTYKIDTEKYIIKQQLESIKQILSRNKEITQMGKEGIYNDGKALQMQIKTMIEAINVIINEEYNGVKLLDGNHLGINEISLETLGISEHSSIDTPTTDDMQDMFQEYNTAIQIVERELSKL